MAMNNKTLKYTKKTLRKILNILIASIRRGTVLQTVQEINVLCRTKSEPSSYFAMEWKKI